MPSEFQSISRIVADSARGGNGAGSQPPAKANPNSGLPKPPSRFSWKLMGMVGGAVLVVALIAGAGTLFTKKFIAAKNIASPHLQYAATTIPLTGLHISGQLTAGSSQQFSVNGQLRINNTAVVAPTTTPTAPELGQIYLSNTNDQLYFYDGTRFVNLGSGQGVLSLQGQTGAVNLVAGSGIGVNGLTINNSGVTSVNGTPNQVNVTQSTGAVSFSLPQDIATGSSPTFAALQVGSLTARPSDTGLVVGSSTQNLSLQGASTSLSAANGGFVSQLVFATPTANSTIIVPDIGGTLCTTSGNCGGGGSSIELQPTSPGSPQTGNGNISGTFIASAFSGNGANLTNVNAAELGGQLPNYYAASGTNSDITSLTALSSITPSSGLAIGASGEALTLQGSAASVFSATAAGSTTSLEFASPTTDANIIFPNTSGTVAVKASGPLQLSASGNLTCPNCLVSGGGGGTAGVVSVNSFTGAVNVVAGTGLGVTNNSGTVTIAADQDISTSATPTFAGLLLNGELGVGTSPNYPIDVSGDVNVSGEYLIDGSPVCTSGGCTSSGGSGNYIQNGTAVQSNANLAIQGGSASSPVALIRGNVSQTGNIFAVQTSSGTNLLAVTAGGEVGVATGSPNYPLDVNGDINTNGALRVDGTAVCSSASGCTPTAGSSNYVQNGTSIQLGANFAVQSGSASSVGGVIRGAVSQTADLLQAQASGGTVLFSVGAGGNGYFAGDLGVGTAVSSSYQINVGGDVNTTGDYLIDGVPICTSTGCTTNGGSGSFIQNGTGIQTTANFAIQSAAAGDVGALVQGASSQTADLLELQTANGTNQFRVTPGGSAYVANNLVVGPVATPTYALEISGDANITGSYRINGVAVCTASGCASSGGSGDYIQNTTTLESENFSIQSAAAATLPTAVIRQANSQTGDLLDLDNSTAGIVAAVNPSGQLRLEGATAYTSALNIGTNTTNAAGGVTFGSDTDLYRSAAGTLTTDGSLQASELMQDGADFSTGLLLQSNTPASTRSTNLTFTDDEATPQSISLRKEGNYLAILDNSGNEQLAFSPVADAEILFGSTLDTDLYRSAADALTTDGALTVGTAFTAKGQTVFKDATNGTNTFEIQNNSNTNLFVADTQDMRIGIDTTTPPAYPLDVNGDVNSSGYYVDGSPICTSSGCIPTTTSAAYIQNGTSIQTSANLAIQSAAAGSVGAVVEGAVSQTANLLQLQASSSTVLDQFTASGALGVQSTTASGAVNIGSNSSTTASAGIYFGTDTDLYRSGSGALTTDGSLAVGGLLQGTDGLSVTGAAANINASSNFATYINTGSSTGAVNIGNSANGGAVTLQSAGVINLTAGAASTVQTTAGNLTLQAGSGTVSLGTSTALTNTSGGLTVSSGGSGQLTLTSGSGAIGTASAIASTGTVNIATNSTTALRVQPAGGGSTLFDADTTDSVVGIGAAPTSSGNTLQVTGTISATATVNVGTSGGGGLSSLSQTALVLNGTTVCTATGGCSPSSGSGNYIQNNTTVEPENFALQSANSASIAALIEGAASQSANLLQIQSSTPTILDQINAAGALSVQSTTASGALNVGTNSSVTAGAGLYFGTDTDLYRSAADTLKTDGALTVGGSTNSTTAFQVQNASGSSVIQTDTANTAVDVGADLNVYGVTPTGPGSASVSAGSNAGGTLSGSAGTTYYYKITAVSPNGESSPSTELVMNGNSFTPESAPSAALTATSNGNGGGSVTCDNINGCTWQATYVNANGETTLGPSSNAIKNLTGGTVTLTNIPAGPAGTTEVEIYLTSASMSWTQVNDISIYDPGTPTSIVDNGTGDVAGYISDGYAENLCSGGSAYNYPCYTTHATTNTNAASLSWSAVAGATSYKVYRGTASNHENALIGTPTATSFSDTGGAGTAVGSPNSDYLKVVDASQQNVLQVGQASSSNSVSGDVVQIGSAPAITTSSTGGAVGTWSSATSLTTAVLGATAVANNGYIYQIGGDTGGTTATTSVYYAQPSTTTGNISSWTAATSLPAALYYSSSAVYNGYVYVLGGTNGSSAQTSAYYAQIQSNGSLGSWTAETGSSLLPTALQSATTVVYNGYLYEMGGLSGSTVEQTVYYAPINSNGSIGSWTNDTANPLPSPTQMATATVSNGYVFEFNGSTGTTTAGADTNIFSAPLNGATGVGSWNTITGNLARAQAGGASYGNWFYLLGGNTGSGLGGVSCAGSEFNASGGLSQNEVGCIDYPGTSQAASAVGSNGYIYQMGGTTTSNGTTATNAVLYTSATPDSAPPGLQVGTNTLFQPSTNSTAAFQIQNAGGGITLFNASTTGNGAITIGAPTTFSLAATATFNGSLAANDGLTEAGGVVTIGGTSDSNALTFGQSTIGQTINIGNATVGPADVNHINIGTSASGTGKEVIAIGSTNSTSALTLNGGNVGITLQASGGTAIDTTGSSSFTVGSTVNTGTLTLGQSTNGETIDIGNGVVSGSVAADTIAIGTAASGLGRDLVTVGSTNSISSLALQGGTGGISLTTGSGGGAITIGSTNNTGTLTLGQATAGETVNIANAAVTGTDTIAIGSGATTGSGGADQVTIGSTAGASTLNLQSGTGYINLLTNSASAGVLDKTNTNSTKALEVLNSSSVAALQVDTTSNTTTVANLVVTSSCTGCSSTPPTLQQAYNAGGTITTTSAGGNVAVTLCSTCSTSFLVNAATGSTGQFAVQAGGTNTFSVSAAGAVTAEDSSASASAFVVQNTSGYAVFTGDTSASQVVLGQASHVNGQLTFANASNGNNITLVSGNVTTSGGYSLTLPTTAGSAGQCLELGGVSTQLQFAACGTSTGLAKNAADTSSAAISASSYLYQFTNSSSAVASGVLQLNNGTNTSTALNVTASGNPGSGQALIVASDTNASPTGKLLDLQAGSSSASVFNVSTNTSGVGTATISSGGTYTGAGIVNISSGGANAINIDTGGAAAINIGATHATSVQVGTPFELTDAGNAFQIASAPTASTTTSLIDLGSGLASGSSSGTFIGVNAASGFTGDLINLEVNGTSEFDVDASGDVRQGNGVSTYNSSSSAPNNYAASTDTLTTGDLLLERIVTANGSTGITLTTPTAASIVAALPKATVGDVFSWLLVNNGTTNNVTLTGGASVSVDAGTSPLGKESQEYISCRLTNVTGGSQAVTCY